MRSARGSWVLLLSIVASACAVDGNDAFSDKESVGAVSQDELTRHPSRYALQLVGTYVADDAHAAMRSLILAADGTFTLSLSGTIETGRWYDAPKALRLPIAITLRAGAHRYTLGVDHFARWRGESRQRVDVVRWGVEQDMYLLPTRAEGLGPSEALCDATHGEWTDDDADAKTGLYCVCPAGTVSTIASGCAR